MALTAKQEKFVQELVAGKTQRQAYLSAGYSGNSSNKTIDENASRIFNDSKVKARYEYLYNKVIKNAENKIQWSFEKSMQKLLDLIDNAEKTEGRNVYHNKHILDIIKEINNMHGYNRQNMSLEAEVTTKTPEQVLKEAQGDSEM